MLKAQGGCKLCSAEINGGIVSSCDTTVWNGMVVKTNTEELIHLRNVALELMLACHPADCTSCAAYLNCELQALLQYLGVAHSRLRRIEKNNTRLASGRPNPLIKREMERCIQCGRCVRACEDLRGVGALAYLRRDGESYVGVKNDAPLTESDCRFCGACVEVCPTGAIQDMPGIFSSGVPRAQALIPCKNACPAHVDIPAYVRLCDEKRYADAAAVLREKLTFPHVLGYVCTHKCEASCKRGHLEKAVTIREIKRIAVEEDRGMLWLERLDSPKSSGKKAAVIGAGPAGLTAAWRLARKGHAISVFERQEQAGGMMRYGIPRYRLSRDILDREISVIERQGVSIVTGKGIDSAPELLAGFDAVLVAVGAQKGVLPKLPVSDCRNVYTAVDFCRLASMDKLPDIGANLMVLGGGSVAFDCARTAKKAGVKTVRVICLEARENMLADAEEISEALAEGIEILPSSSCTAVEKQDALAVGITVSAVRSFHFGAKGLELDLEPGGEQKLAASCLVFATGQRIDLGESFGLTLGRGNSVVVNADYEASIPGIFAAGDAVTGTRSIVEVIASAAEAASAIDKYLGGDGNVEEVYYRREPLSNRLCDNKSNCLRCDLRLLIPKVKLYNDPCFRKRGKEAPG
jgi:NADPH-dependent glutamate synthase beta subunit-like oxidoreductase/Pyruvate/2-oxoacid:ferredoxin oxidoreductase delta subunit